METKHLIIKDRKQPIADFEDVTDIVVDEETGDVTFKEKGVERVLKKDPHMGYTVQIDKYTIPFTEYEVVGRRTVNRRGYLDNIDARTTKKLGGKLPRTRKTD